MVSNIVGIGPEDHLPDGGEEGPGAEAGGGEETRRGDQLLEADQSAAEGPAGGHHFTEKIDIINSFVITKSERQRDRPEITGKEREIEKKKGERERVCMRERERGGRFSFTLLKIAKRILQNT